MHDLRLVLLSSGLYRSDYMALLITVLGASTSKLWTGLTASPLICVCHHTGRRDPHVGLQTG
jgi:hypothetical protein